MHREELPEFDSDDELREWFDTADLSAYALDDALEVVVATQVHLVVGDEEVAPEFSSGTTGTLREPVRVVEV